VSKVQKVLDLYRMGLPIEEIAKTVYGEANKKTKHRVSQIIYLYGKKLGKLNKNEVLDTHRGEYIDPQNGLVIREQIRDEYVSHSSPVHPQAPFLGANYNIRQLRASLNSKDRRVVDVLTHVDSIFGVLGNIEHDSVVRQTACLIASMNANLSTWLVKIAFTSVVVSLVFHGYNPGDLFELVQYVYPRLKPREAIREVLGLGFRLPSHVLKEVLLRAILNGEISEEPDMGSDIPA